jgi:hypothetical protein
MRSSPDAVELRKPGVPIMVRDGEHHQIDATSFSVPRPLEPNALRRKRLH